MPIKIWREAYSIELNIKFSKTNEKLIQLHSKKITKLRKFLNIVVTFMLKVDGIKRKR